MSPVKSRARRAPLVASVISAMAAPRMCADAHKAEAYLIGQLHGLAKGHRTEARETLLRLFQGVQGKGGGVLGTFLLIVEGRVFFLQIAGVGQDDAA